MSLENYSGIELGLVIEEATYGPSDEDEESKDLVVDVTVAVQALVNNSQLHIPAHRSKVCTKLSFGLPLFSQFIQSAIQGFVDPAPTLAKSLYVRYYFRGNKHYAEIPDHQPVVLPLKGTSPFATIACQLGLIADIVQFQMYSRTLYLVIALMCIYYPPHSSPGGDLDILSLTRRIFFEKEDFTDVC